MNKCICQRALQSHRGEALNKEKISNCNEAFIHYNENKAYITLVCEDCESPLYLSISHCPFCGENLQNIKVGDLVLHNSPNVCEVAKIDGEKITLLDTCNGEVKVTNIKECFKI